MKLETIYNKLNEITKNEDFIKLPSLLEEISNAIKLETCYKRTGKTRVNAIKRVADKKGVRPALAGYGIYEDFKIVTDSYHLIMIKEDTLPLKLVTTDEKLIDEVGKENCIIANYPNVASIVNFNKDYYKTIELDFDDISQFYKLHNKNADKELYEVDNKFYNIKYLKNIIDVIGTDIIVYVSNDKEYRPLYVENKKGELGLVLPMRKY